MKIRSSLIIGIVVLVFTLVSWYFNSNGRPSIDTLLSDGTAGHTKSIRFNGLSNNSLTADQRSPAPPPLVSKQNLEDVGPWKADFTKLGEVEKELRMGGGTLDSNQELTATATRRLNLDESQVKIINQSLKTSFAAALALMRKNMVPVKVLDSEDKVLGKYRISPDPDKGTELIKELHQNLSDKIGRETSDRVLNSLNFWSLYGGYGLLDGDLIFTDTIIGGESSTTVTSMQFEMRHPRTGQALHYGSVLFEDLSKFFGEQGFSIESGE